MNISNSNQYGLAAEDALERFENSIACELPPDYRQFLLKHNGGTPSNGDGHVFCFFPLREIECREHRVVELQDLSGWPLHCARKDFLRETKGEIDDGDLSMLPIGTDGNGNYVSLALDEDRHGRIFFFDHETFEFIKVANSFADFLDNPVL